VLISHYYLLGAISIMVYRGLTYCAFICLSLSSCIFGKFNWINPFPSPWTLDNPVWAIDSLHNLTRSTDWSTMQLRIYHENACRLPDLWVQPPAKLFERTAPPEYYTFTASVPSVNLSVSNVFYFEAVGGIAKTTVRLLARHITSTYRTSPLTVTA